MGDDAEYWIEQQAEESAFKSLINHRSGCKRLICWLDDTENEVWSWAPGCRTSEWIHPLHRDLEVGSKFFLATNIYSHDDQDIETSTQGPLSKINGLAYKITIDKDKACFEVITISRRELDKIKKIAEKLKSQASSLKEECFAEMTAEIAAFIKEESETETFVFHMEI